ncbi:AAA family ATPase [Shewanella sp. WXL01]|uniref:AAA family ATPase n=1 Tax=Shewanella sp. WXL01 TaxID=2709721 RepID=UPI0014384AA9|nr:AAA family ATPase [Shewanella sp. WXL01]
MSAEHFLLLPTQESVVNRLQHLASYGEQVTVLCGAKGSGKSTLATVLATELDDHNSALIVCPAHVDAAEIRRKILVQLLSAPIFDDEVPLPETLLKVQSSLQKPLHIIIDDAHLLPLEIWVECILLSQLCCAGKLVTVTLTCLYEPWSALSTQLGQSMAEHLLQVDVDPLPIAEREGLYRTLLTQSGQSPFIPREIVSGKLEKQLGSPAEVIELLGVALAEPELEVAKWRQWIKPMLNVAIILVITVIAIFGYQYKTALGLNELSSLPVDSAANQPVKNSIELTALQTLQHKRAQQANVNWASRFFEVQHEQASLSTQTLLLGLLNVQSRFDSSEKVQAQVIATVNAPIVEHEYVEESKHVGAHLFGAEPVKHELANAESAMNNSVNDLVNSESQEIEMQHGTAEESSVITANSAQISQADLAEVELASAEPIETLTEQDNRVPRNGYTLQLASVTQQKSLKPFLSALASDTNWYLSEHKSMFVLFVGNFSSMSDASEKAKQLQSEFGFAAPWVRKWQDLSDYQISSNQL